jgi:hypothetical protein
MVTPRHVCADTDFRRGYSCNPFVTSALEEGGWSATRFGLFTPGVDPVPIVQEAA